MKHPGNLILFGLLLIGGLSLWLERSARPTPNLPAGIEGGRPGGTGSGSARATWAGAGGPDVIHLVVLNGTSRPGLARAVSLALAGAGCVSERVANAPVQDLPRTILVNRRLPERDAQAFARRLGMVPLVPEKDERTTEDAVLILGADWRRVWRALGLPGRGPAAAADPG